LARAIKNRTENNLFHHASRLRLPCSTLTLIVFASLILNAVDSNHLHNSPRPVQVDVVEFNRDIFPIFETSCTTCHGPDIQEAELRLDTEIAALAGGINGHAFIPGKSEGSLLVKHLLGQNVPQMPFNETPLSSEKIALIRSWIDSSKLTSFKTTSSSTKVPHWAYVKPERPALPEVHTTDWARNPIDRFVLSALESENLSPSPEASSATLLRRLSLDLTGLPPTVEELDAFLADTSPAAYETTVERLLASPHYGERWARPWLDLARYADTDGYEKDLPRAIWKYRDWVIEALNNDMSFKQFTIEQIAGDMLPNPTIGQQIATGFHRNTLSNKEGGVDDEEARWETLVDRVNTTATVWLGSTIACAQCHTHKFDPFSHEEYYKFLAFFNNTDYEIEKPDGLGQGESWVVEPELTLPTSEQAIQSQATSEELERLRITLDTATPELDTAQDIWETEVQQAHNTWTTLTPIEYKSAGGATLTRLIDDSILASGLNPEADTYTITATTEIRRITGIRLELLEDPSLPASGPGRDEEGNFFLSKFDVVIAPIDSPALSATLSLTDVIANDWQAGYEVTRTLSEAQEAGGWALSETPSKTQGKTQAVFLPTRPFGFGVGTDITVRLAHNMKRASRNIGRFRLSVTTATDPTTIVRVPIKLHSTLKKPLANRTAKEASELASVHRALTPLLQPIGDRIQTLEARLADLEIPTTMIMRERGLDERPSARMRFRGTFTLPGRKVLADVPTVLHPFPDGQRLNRLGLAHWLVDDDNPLVGRVTVNRLWENLFGRGLVETSEDFGSQGATPTHTDLLDWLAVEFIEEHWSLKEILRTIVTSATYRQASIGNETLENHDPYNLLLARGPRFRVEAEMVRDIALAVSGLLNRKIGGPSVHPYQPDGVWNRPYSDDQWIMSKGMDRYRRGLYTFVRRTAPYPSMNTFDAPSREFTQARRINTNTPLQALTTLNDPVFFEAAQYLAARIFRETDLRATVAARIRYAFRLVLSREPNLKELDALTQFYREELARLNTDVVSAGNIVDGGPNPGLRTTELAAWTMLSNVMLNLDETITKE